MFINGINKFEFLKKWVFTVCSLTFTVELISILTNESISCINFLKKILKSKCSAYRVHLIWIETKYDRIGDKFIYEKEQIRINLNIKQHFP